MKIEKKIETIIKKTNNLMKKIDPSLPLEPRSKSCGGRYTDKFETFFRPNWTYSFYLGVVMLVYRYTGDTRYIEYLKKCTGVYTDFLFKNEAEIGHDTGFLYSLYAVPMFKETNEKIYDVLAEKAADEIAKRFRIKPCHIQAFFDLRNRGITDTVSLLIADDMMNMNLIMREYEKTGHSFYCDVFENHILTSAKYLVRDDFSTRHAYNFDVKTGEPLGEMNYCGYSIGSYWSRGAAWIIYGLASALRFTGESEKYRYKLEGVLKKYLDSLEGNIIPPWDFRCDEECFLDTSAAAIVASAAYIIKDFDINERLKERAMKYSDDVILTLCSDEYFAPEEKEFLIVYENGEGSLWGDYFFCELLMKKHMKEKYSDMWF